MRERGFLKIDCVWGLGQYKTKSCCRADGQMVVNGRQEAPCLFTLASLGDETDRGNNLRVNKAPFLLLTISISALGCFACSTVVHSPIHQFTTLALSSCESSFSTIVLNWGAFLPCMPDLAYLIYLCIGSLCTHSYFGPLPLPLYSGGSVPPFYLGVSLRPLFLGCQSGLPKLGCEYSMALYFFMPC